MILAEENRLESVERFKQLNFSQNKELQEIVALAAEICNVPVAMITLLDEDTNRFLVCQGLDITESPREISFCQYTVLQEGVLEIADTTKDERFITNPMVTNAPGVRFYAGAPLCANDGGNIGSLCVLDAQPHTLTHIQHQMLSVLSRQVMYLMEIEYSKYLTQEQRYEIEIQNQALMKIAYIQSHEFRGPVASILGLMSLIKEENYTPPPHLLHMMEDVVKALDEKIQTVVTYSATKYSELQKILV
ncbi:MAG: GAF domain-containing protein [Taibaiella sp.]|nr:GAF domain-containing protein [Taibaiella sp.]